MTARPTYTKNLTVPRPVRSGPPAQGVAVLAIAVAILGVVTRPFLFEPIAAILLLVASKQTEDRRLTFPGIVLITICAVLGAALAAVGGHALY